MWSLSNVSSQFFCFIFLLRTRFSIELKEGAIVIKYSLVSQLAFELFARLWRLMCKEQSFYNFKMIFACCVIKPVYINQ